MADSFRRLEENHSGTEDFLTPAPEVRNVYFVVWWFDRAGGMERHVTELAMALTRRGTQVKVFSEMPLSRSNAYAIALKKAGIPVFAPGRLSSVIAGAERSRIGRRLVGAPSIAGGGWNGIDDEFLRFHHCGHLTRRLFASMVREAATSPPDVVHLHGCRLGQHRVLQWAAARQYATVYTEHTTMSDWGGPFDSESPWIVDATADALACVSNRSGQSLAAVLPGTRIIPVVRHIIQGPAPNDKPVSHSPGQTPVSILYVGRLSFQKGLDTLLDAVALLHAQGIGCHLQIAGTGDQLPALLAQADRLRITDSVNFLGHLEHDEIGLLRARADLGVVPSRTEGLPLTLVEAMAHGKPVVATRVGGIPEVISDGENGLLVEPGDPHELAAALGRLLTDPALALRLGTAARQAFEAGGWSEESAVKESLALYRGARAARSKTTRADLSTSRDWVRKQTTGEMKAMRQVWFFAWGMGTGSMEYSITRQAVALAQSGVQVLMFIETPRPPFNRYITEMRKAGVRFIAPGHLAYGLHTLNPRLVRMRGIAGDFARELSRHRPDAIHIHGWRFGGARESLRVIMRRAAEHAIPAIYAEYAGEDDWPRPPNHAELALIQMASVLSAASASARRSLLNALGENTHVTLFRHSAPDRPEPPLLRAEVRLSLRVFTMMSTPETLRLLQKAHSSSIQLDLTSGPAADLLAGCHAALLNPALPGFGIALAEAMAQFVPVVIAGSAAGLPIVHRANGLVAADDPLDPLMELAADPLLAHQFAIAARRTFEAHGLRDLAIVAEAAALYRPQLAKGAAVYAGC